MHSLLMDINGLVYLPIDSTIMDNPFIYKLVPCQHFLQGICRKSDAECRFSHGSMLPLPTYSQPQSYWYNVTLDPITSKWILESIPDTAHKKQPPAISMATGLPLVNRKSQQGPSRFQFPGHPGPGYPGPGYPGPGHPGPGHSGRGHSGTGHSGRGHSGPGIMGAKPAGFPPLGRQGGKPSSYQGRAKYRNSPATHPHQSSGKRRSKKQLASRQGNPSSEATTVNDPKPVEMTPDNASLIESLDAMKIRSPDSDNSSVSSWASLSSKVSTKSKSIPAFSRTNFPGLPGSNNEGLPHDAEQSNQSSESKTPEVATSPRGAWALGGPQKRFSPTKIAAASSETKPSGTSTTE